MANPTGDSSSSPSSSSTHPTTAATNSSSSMASTVKAYAIPFVLFVLSLFFQLVVMPRSFPPSHYDALGLKMYSSVEDVTKAYEQLSAKWKSGLDVPPTADFIKVRYAFEFLTNQLWKRDYDIYGIDEQFHVIEKAKAQYNGKEISQINLPLLEAPSSDLVDNAFGVIDSENFMSKLDNDKGLLIQVFSMGSRRSAEFFNSWRRIVELLDGVAYTGMVELGDVQLTRHLAERKSSGKPFFRSGVPTFIAFPPGCKSSDCLQRYRGELSVDAVTEWFATTILNLPRIFYFSKESLAQNFLAKSKAHKVKVIFFSETGQRATPFVRQTANNYWTFATFAFIRWLESDSSLWWKMFSVESAPAIVFLKDPGVKPIVYHGPINNSLLVKLMEKNKYQELPQLRSVTSKELGCDARGYSRAGNDTRIWYCVIVAGRMSPELNRMRETMRRVQERLSSEGDSSTFDQDPSSMQAAVAMKQQRLTFTWLDGEAQKQYCFFHINSETSYETCGPRRDITDVPQLFVIRYERNASDEEMNTPRRPRNLIEALHDVDTDPASQLVAKYTGSSDTQEIIRWISGIVENGDSKILPPFKTKSPELVPEDADPIWSRGSEKVLSTSRGLKQTFDSIVNQIYDRLGDPMIGPVLLLGALMSFGRIWLQRSQTTRSNGSNPPSAGEEESRQDKVRRRGNRVNQVIPPSITDVEPEDAYQMQFSDSDGEQ